MMAGEDELPLSCLNHAVEVKTGIERLRRRSHHKSTITFNLEALTEGEGMASYRFSRAHIGVLADFIHLEGIFARHNRYFF